VLIRSIWKESPFYNKLSNKHKNSPLKFVHPKSFGTDLEESPSPPPLLCSWDKFDLVDPPNWVKKVEGERRKGYGRSDEGRRGRRLLLSLSAIEVNITNRI
jgi:hypothetical protein